MEPFVSNDFLIHLSLIDTWKDTYLIISYFRFKYFSSGFHNIYMTLWLNTYASYQPMYLTKEI